MLRSGWLRMAGGAESLLGLVGFALVLTGPLESLAQGADDGLAVLRLVDKAREANRGQLLSWQGKGRVVNTSYEDTGEVESRLVVTGSFAFDHRRQATRWSQTVEESSERRDGKLVAVPGACWTSAAMRRDGVLFRFVPTLGLCLRLAKKAPVTQMPIERDFDPMWFFTVHGGDLHVLLVRLRWSERYPKLDASKVKREGNLVTWRATTGWIRNTFVFDLAKGGNVVHYSEGGGVIAIDHVWTYRRFGEVWVPQSYRSETRRGRRGKEKLNSVREVVLLESRVNVALPPDEFAVEKLGVRASTWVMDDIAGLGYRLGRPDAQ